MNTLSFFSEKHNPIPLPKGTKEGAKHVQSLPVTCEGPIHETEGACPHVLEGDRNDLLPLHIRASQGKVEIKQKHISCPKIQHKSDIGPNEHGWAHCRNEFSETQKVTFPQLSWLYVLLTVANMYGELYLCLIPGS